MKPGSFSSGGWRGARVFCCAAALLAGRAVADSPAADGDVLRLRRGDVLHGTLVGLGTDGALAWRRADMPRSIVFNRDSVLDLQLAPRPVRAPPPPPRLAVEFTNRDRLTGDLVALDGRTLQFTAWYAGAVTAERTMIRRLVFLAAPSGVLYAGPTEAAGWTITKGTRGAWTFKDQAFYIPLRANGGLGRNVHLPDAASIEFNLAWRGLLYLQCSCYCDKLDTSYNQGNCTLQFTPRSVLLTLPGVSRQSRTAPAPQLQAKTKVRVAIRVNKTMRTLALLLDDELVKQWTDLEALPGKGQGLYFYARGMCALRLANIVVAPWDGRLDEAAAAADADEDLVQLANGDKLSGAVRRLAPAGAVIAARFGELHVPLERISAIEFAGRRSERPRRRAGDALATLADGGRCTLELEKIADQQLIGHSETCGRLALRLDAFRRLQFHIYEAPPQLGGVDGNLPDDSDAGADDQPIQVQIF